MLERSRGELKRNAGWLGIATGGGERVEEGGALTCLGWVNFDVQAASGRTWKGRCPAKSWWLEPVGVMVRGCIHSRRMPFAAGLGCVSNVTLGDKVARPQSPRSRDAGVR